MNRRPGGRRSGDSGTREAILDAARAQFAENGYQGATIRGIAAVAGVDPALVHHFYGAKEALFAAAMQLPVIPSEVLTAALRAHPADVGIGEHLVRTALGLWESEQLRDKFVGLLRSAMTSEQAAAMLTEFVSESILATVATVTGLTERVGEAEAEFRTGLIGTQMLGLGLARMVLALPPVAAASVDELAAAVGPTVDRYLAGDLAS